jgi:hypothetical protein
MSESAATEPTAQSQVAPARERVALGLLGALVGVLAGAALSVVVWEMGFIASITSFVLAAAAVFLYGVLAGSAPRRGLVPLVLLIVLGVVGTFFLLVGWDAAAAYDDLTEQFGPADLSKREFVTSSITDTEVLGAYAKDMALFFGFALLGIWTTLRGLFSRS